MRFSCIRLAEQTEQKFRRIRDCLREKMRNMTEKSASLILRFNIYLAKAIRSFQLCLA